MNKNNSIWYRVVRVVLIGLFGSIAFIQINDGMPSYLVYTLVIFILFWWGFYYIATGKLFPDSVDEDK